MSERRNKMMYRKELLGKENIFDAKLLNKLTATDSQKVIPRKRVFSADLECPCTCNCAVKNDLVGSATKSSAKKTPFRIYFDRAGNDIEKGVRFRERIAEYDTRRVERFRTIRDFPNKQEKTDGTIALAKKLQPELNLLQDPPQNYKENKAISCNSIISGSKPIIRSIIAVSQADLPKILTGKSWVDLSQVNKPSIKRASSTVKLNTAKLTPAEGNLNKKRSLSSSSVTKSNNLVDDWNRVHLRSRSCSNRPAAVQTGNKVISTKGILTNVQKNEIESDKCKKLGGSKDLLVSGPSAVLSSNSKKEQKQFTTADENYRINENANHQLPSTSKDQKSNDRKEQPLIDVIPKKVQAKVESDLDVIRQNTDFSAYLLYHSDYLVDLLMIEKDRENLSPRLSPEFIDEYINNESRKAVVASLIRLTTHCRYPSFILFQAVKIFDAIIDKASIKETDLQLVAVTALWIVLKKDGNFNKIPSVVKQAHRAAKTMVEIAQGIADVNTLVTWEREILRILDFNITFSDPFSIFVFYLINYDYNSDVPSGIITKMYYCGGYIIDLTLLDTKFSYATSNLLGLIAAELVMSIVLDDEATLSSPRWHYWRGVITNGIHVPIRYYDDEIQVLRAMIIIHILESAKKHTKEEIVRKRYSHNRYGNISEYFLNKIMKLPQAEYSICM